MNWDVIYENLNKQGFYPTESNSDIVDFYVKVTEDNKMFISVILKCLDGVNVTPESINKSAKRLESKFLIGGYNDVKVMHIIFTDKEMSVEKLEEDTDNNFWIVDMVEGKVKVYENQPDDYFGMRKVIEEEIRQCVAYEREESQRRFADIPGVTVALVLINVLVFILCLTGKYIGIDANLMELGCNDYNKVYNSGEYYRLFTSMFLHDGIDHIMSNMCVLILIGLQIEKFIGHFEYTVVYLLSGLGGSVASVVYHMMINDNAVSVGASGAISGLLSLVLVTVLLTGDWRREGLRVLFAAILLIVGSMGENIDMLGHLGGMVVGTIIALGLLIGKEKINEG